MRVLIIDDDRTVCSSLKLLLGRKGFDVMEVHHPAIALETVAEYNPALILLDMNFTIDTSGKQGLRLFKQIREAHSQVSVILMTGWATVQLAVEGMKLGARDFIAKPWDNKDLLSSINNIKQLHHPDGSDELVSKSNKTNGSIIGESEEMREILDMVSKVAATEASVLITGESGTGKELIAEAIHQGSNRKEEAFVKVNLGGIPTTLFESEMFGYKRGAFTGADVDKDGRFTKANKGTIFLDELGELDLTCQVKLLRVLQEKTFEPLGSNQTTRSDVRVVSATNRDLQDMAVKGHFREDLFYRINLLHIHLPPLRDRPDDIPLLADYFLSNVSKLYSSEVPSIDSSTVDWLRVQDYKGNIRQLKNIVERSFLLNVGKPELDIKDFSSAFNISQTSMSQPKGLNLEAMEIETIRKALTKHKHSISASARALGITRSSLYRRLEKYGIKHEPKA